MSLEVFIDRGEYRYGYQGSERDDEISGGGNSYTTTYRMLDPRLGRWKSIDPMAHIYPWSSPYVSMGNSPILINDPHGDIIPIVIGGYLLGEAAIAWIFAGAAVTTVAVVYSDDIVEGINGTLEGVWGNPSTWSYGRGEPFSPPGGGSNEPSPNGWKNWLYGGATTAVLIQQLYSTYDVEDPFNRPLPEVPGQTPKKSEKTEFSDSPLDDALSIDIFETKYTEGADNKSIITTRANLMYRIKDGDNLGNIAKNFGVSVEDIMLWNPSIEDKNVIKQGDDIVVNQFETLSEAPTD